MNKKYQLPLIIALCGIGYAGHSFYGFFSEGVPSLERGLRDRESNLAIKKAELRRLRSFSENIDEVKLALRELNLQLEAAVETMPREFDHSGLLRKLSVIGFNSGVDISAYRPDPEGNKEGDFYEVGSVSFNLTGSFTQVMAFFDQVLRLKRLVRIDKLSLNSVSGSPNATVKNSSGTGTSVTVIAKLYRFAE